LCIVSHQASTSAITAYQVRGQQLLSYQHPGHTHAGVRIPDSLSRYLNPPMYDNFQLTI